MIIHLLQAFVLGAVQGITEFLPISSTAHLIIGERLFSLDQNTYGLSFDMFTNLGTVIATIVFFWKDLVDIFGRLRLPSSSKPLSQDEKLPWTLLIATIPVGLAGLVLQKRIESDFRTFPIIAASLIIVGILMIWVEKKSKHTQKSEPSTKQVFGISLSQIIAFIPGVSRSGITISTAMGMGFDRVAAARYSFLLSLPVTTAAIVLQLAKFGKGLSENGISGDVASFYIVGGLTSLIVGYLTIKFLLDFYRKYSLASFAYYRFALAAVLIVSVLVWHA
jgi:undecaprenyl-diphosphatase